MKVDGKPYRSIWLEPDGQTVGIIDQTRLPWAFETATLRTPADAAHAISAMLVRGAPLIGATAAYGLALAAREDATMPALEQAAKRLNATRPTAVNLAWATSRMLARLHATSPADRARAAFAEAARIADEDAAQCEAIGRHGAPLIEAISTSKRARVNIFTHCNAGWLATVDWGTALAPIYIAHERGIDIHVWVDETRPRNQGASLTAWELGHHGVAHTVIADNAGGHLMQQGAVDLVIVGADRVTRNGDVANKIGTYLKALAAHDNAVPFHVAVPSSTIDWALASGRDIPIEERNGAEVASLTGLAADGAITTIRVVPETSPTANPAFDVTPARLVTGLITERGTCPATAAGLRALFPEAA